ncbi:1-deoxy-D-xylulose-5-phosphate reductoisomerase [Candidatus Bipolaricaulota bacterium]|nr:1-deoxy-D-xylulose-5-phosphate reductoisomerase [Candidatus Bipolaricaulota bacterium]
MRGAERRVVILGSTGSIGVQTLDVIERLNRKTHLFSVIGLSAGKNVDLLAEQIRRFSPIAVSIEDEEGAEELHRHFQTIEILVGEEGLSELARLKRADLIVNALVGAVGLAPTLAALSLGRTVALANKESLVIGGELVTASLHEDGGTLLPIDSEHNALLQCLRAGKISEVKQVVITASGGPFLRRPIEELAHVRPEEALSHPNWAMGSRITIDSATMVNKGFEVIEAHHLFSLPYKQIDVIIHPGSHVHSLVEYKDGSILAELAASDMRIPIQYALTHPERIDTGLPRLNLDITAPLKFEPLDPGRFPAFTTVLHAAKEGGTAPAAINAADEILVKRFLTGEIPFTGIAAGLEVILNRWVALKGSPDEEHGKISLQTIRSIDRWARSEAAALQW